MASIRLYHILLYIKNLDTLVLRKTLTKVLSPYVRNTVATQIKVDQTQISLF